MKIKLTQVILFLIMICIMTNGYSQNYHSSKFGGKKVKTRKRYKDHKGPTFTKQIGKKIIKDVLNMRKDMELRIIGDVKPRFYRADAPKNMIRGLSHANFRQYYKNIPIDGAGVSVTIKHNKIISFMGTLVDSLEIDVNPALSEAPALEHVLQQIGAEEYEWERTPKPKNPGSKCGGAKGPSKFGILPKGELMIAKSNIPGNPNKDYTLVYRFYIRVTKPFSSKVYHINANTGAIWSEYNQIVNYAPLTTSATAKTKYSGTQYMDTIYRLTFNDWILEDPVRHLRTVDGRDEPGTIESGGGCKYDPAIFYNWWNEDTNWDLEATKTNVTNAVLDAHWGAEVVYDYFKEIHATEIIYPNQDDTGVWTVPYACENFPIAQADPARGLIKIGIGDAYFSMQSSIDIIAHEWAHIVIRTQFPDLSAGFDYSNGYSGVIEEAICIMFGSGAEYFANSKYAALEKNVFSSGEETDKLGSYSGPYNFVEPEKSRPPQPKEYFGDRWPETDCSPSESNGYCDTHIKTGFLNHWFYLVSNGDYFRDIPISRIGIENTAEVVFDAISKLNPNSDYLDLANATLQAAEDLFGYHGFEWDNIKKAWIAVGIEDTFLGIDPPVYDPFARNLTLDNVTEIGNFLYCGDHNSITAPGIGFYNVLNGADITHKADTYINLRPGFHAEAGSKYKALIGYNCN